MALHPFEKIAKKHFGVTDNLEETGYVLSDGSFLDLSGRHYATGYERRGDRFVPRKRQPDYLYGQRAVDHRELPIEIKDALGKDGGEAMFAFLRATGALRVMPGVGFLVAKMPSREAVTQIVREWHHAFGPDPIFVDVVTREGDVWESQEFAHPRADDIVAFLEAKFGGASLGAAGSGSFFRYFGVGNPDESRATIQLFVDDEFVGAIFLRKESFLPEDNQDPHTPCWQVAGIDVVERFRRRGYGTRLYEEAAKIADQHGMSLCSDTPMSLSKEALSFWEKQVEKGRAYWEVPGGPEYEGENYDDGRFVLNRPVPESLT